jgi:cell wall-associated NlpC family hydrolase
VTLPVAAAGDEHQPTAQAATAAPNPPAVDQLLDMPPALHQLLAAPVPQHVVEKIGAAPELERRQARPASRSATRKARPAVRARAHRVESRQARTVATVRTVAKRTTVRHAKPVKRTVVRKAAAAPRGLAGVAAFARKQVGKPYRWGQAGLNGYDCSGLVKRSYREGAGIGLPHQSGAQAGRAYRISRAAARPGDLVVGNGHVGIYMGRGMMVDAPGRGRKVTYRKMYSGLWIERVRR